MADKIETPREFYSNVVVVDILEFLNTQDDLRLAYHACVSLLSLRDWIFITSVNSSWLWMGATQRPFTSKRDFQERLEVINGEFRIITDVANASKHLVLDRNRSRTQAQGVANVHIHSVSTIIGGALLGNMGFNTTILNDAGTIVTEDAIVINDGGRLYDVKTSVEAVNKVWFGLIEENNW